MFLPFYILKLVRYWGLTLKSSGRLGCFPGEVLAWRTVEKVLENQ